MGEALLDKESQEPDRFEKDYLDNVLVGCKPGSASASTAVAGDLQKGRV